MQCFYINNEKENLLRFQFEMAAFKSAQKDIWYIAKTIKVDHLGRAWEKRPLPET